MDILNFDANAKVLPLVYAEYEKAFHPERCEEIYEDFILAKPETSVPYSSVIQWTQALVFFEIAFMVDEMKLEIENFGAKLKGIQLSIEDRKAIVSMEIPITQSIPVIVEALNKLAL